MRSSVQQRKLILEQEKSVGNLAHIQSRQRIQLRQAQFGFFRVHNRELQIARLQLCNDLPAKPNVIDAAHRMDGMRAIEHATEAPALIQVQRARAGRARHDKACDVDRTQFFSLGNRPYLIDFYHFNPCMP